MTSAFISAAGLLAYPVLAVAVATAWTDRREIAAWSRARRRDLVDLWRLWRLGADRRIAWALRGWKGEEAIHDARGGRSRRPDRR